MVQNMEAIHPDACMLLDWDKVVHYTMIQLSMKAGMKRWGDKAKQAVSDELKQLHYCTTFEPLHPKKLSPEEQAGVLELHLFLQGK
jgi:hypothetical protein